MSFLRTLIIVGIPFIVAVAAGMAAVVWIFGLPGDWNAGYVPGWVIGGIAIAAFLHAYAIYVVAAIIVVLAKWPLINLLHGLIWTCTAIFIITMAVSISMIMGAS